MKLQFILCSTIFTVTLYAVIGMTLIPTVMAGYPNSPSQKPATISSPSSDSDSEPLFVYEYVEFDDDIEIDEYVEFDDDIEIDDDVEFDDDIEIPDGYYSDPGPLSNIEDLGTGSFLRSDPKYHGEDYRGL